MSAFKNLLFSKENKLNFLADLNNAYYIRRAMEKYRTNVIILLERYI